MENKLETVSNAKSLQNRQHAVLTLGPIVVDRGQTGQFDNGMRDYIHDLSLHAEFHLKRLILVPPRNDYVA